MAGSGTSGTALSNQGSNVAGKIANSMLNNGSYIQSALNPNNQFMYDLK